MRRCLPLAFFLLAGPALALSHFQANRIHIFTPAGCPAAYNPVWITLGAGQAAPGFHNVTAPQFDEIGALLTGNQPGQTEAALTSQPGACGLIASFYENASPAGAWPIPAEKLPQLLAILNGNG
jgi:hypothetical protein